MPRKPKPHLNLGEKILSSEELKAVGEEYRQRDKFKLPGDLDKEEPYTPLGFLLVTSTGRPFVHKLDGSFVYADEPDGELCISGKDIKPV